MAKGGKWAEVRCDTHGKVEASDRNNLKRVICGLGTTKKQRLYGGCPQCKIEKKNQTQ